MTRLDYQTLYLALGFILAQLEKPSEPHLALPGRIYARKIEEYCRANRENAFPPVRVIFVHETDTTETDKAIGKYLVEYRRVGRATLPQDIDQLRALHLRLQLRKMLKMQSMFYATAPNEFLAESIQSYLKEEIEEAGEA